MLIRKNDDNNDWTFGSGLISPDNKDLKIKQDIDTRLGEWYRDCYFKMLNGIDYANFLTIRDSQTFANLEFTIRAKILETEDVVQIKDFSLTFDNRNVVIYYHILTKFSTEIQSTVSFEA